MEALGAQIELRDGYVHAKAPQGLERCDDRISLCLGWRHRKCAFGRDFGRGTTILKQRAREPEIVDLAECLIAMGAQIDGRRHLHASTIQGVDRLHGATHPVVTDRIELGTYMLAPAFTGGEVECLGGRIAPR